MMSEIPWNSPWFHSLDERDIILETAFFLLKMKLLTQRLRRFNFVNFFDVWRQELIDAIIFTLFTWAVKFASFQFNFQLIWLLRTEVFIREIPSKSFISSNSWTLIDHLSLIQANIILVIVRKWVVALLELWTVWTKILLIWDYLIILFEHIQQLSYDLLLLLLGHMFDATQDFGDLFPLLESLPDLHRYARLTFLRLLELLRDTRTAILRFHIRYC